MQLRVLCIKNPAESILEALDRNPDGGERETTWFKTLEELTLECSPRGGLGEGVSLLKRVGNIKNLKTLDIARTGGIPTESELGGFIQALSNLTIERPPAKTSTTLRILHIHQGDETGFLAPGDLPTPVSKYTTTLSTLSPLLDFPNLSELSIMVDTRFSLDDRDAWTMARAWPKLKQLELGYGGGGWGREGKTFTLEGLRAFAQCCPDLEELGVSVNIISMESALDTQCGHQGTEGGEKTIIGSGGVDSAGVSAHRLRYLELGNSVYTGEPERVARSLLEIFPKLCRVYGPSMAVSPEWERKWMRVSKLVSEMQGSTSVSTLFLTPHRNQRD
ncbi:hypothetical protein AN958_02081 [Leucoagaricus sp. SymC.cos]|nr:hypothetical protein AN958_02081 [Leucoagaricus sp. SymC.cos]